MYPAGLNRIWLDQKGIETSTSEIRRIPSGREEVTVRILKEWVKTED